MKATFEVVDNRLVLRLHPESRNEAYDLYNLWNMHPRPKTEIINYCIHATLETEHGRNNSYFSIWISYEKPQNKWLKFLKKIANQIKRANKRFEKKNTVTFTM